MNLLPGSTADRYTVVGLLGQGGMASVYLVTHQHLGSSHVLKVLSLPGAQIAERLMREGQIQALLKHPNVVEVTDVVQIHGAPGLVMELVRGPAFDEVLAGGLLPIELTDALVPGILAGVAAAHEVGVVHRDLKPANILLSMRRSTLVPKVADFGLVKLAEGSGPGPATKTGATMGTPQYMAPEQIQSAKDVDARADVFALGAILYEMVTGQRAFDGETAFDVFSAVVKGDYTPVQELRPEAPQRMVDAIDSALAALEDRPADVNTLWSLWSGGSSLTLEQAAGAPVRCPEEMAEMLLSLAPILPVPSQESTPPLDATASAETFVEEALEPPQSIHQGRTGVGIVGCGALGLLVVVLVSGLGGAGILFFGWSPQEVTPQRPVLVEPVPEPPRPVPSPAPIEVPTPEPIAPVPPKPIPVPKPPAEPVAEGGTGTVTVSGAKVSLIGGGKTYGPGDVPLGSYQVSAEFEGLPKSTHGIVVVEEGKAVHITCEASLNRCTF